MATGRSTLETRIGREDKDKSKSSIALSLASSLGRWRDSSSMMALDLRSLKPKMLASISGAANATGGREGD